MASDMAGVKSVVLATLGFASLDDVILNTIVIQLNYPPPPPPLGPLLRRAF